MKRVTFAILGVVTAISWVLIAPGTSQAVIRDQVIGAIDNRYPQDFPGTYPTTVNGWVDEVHWADIQSTAGGPVDPNNVIAGAIQNVATYNQAHPTDPPMRIRFRVTAGVDSPPWVMNDCGSVMMDDPTAPNPTFVPIPKWWTSCFLADYQTLVDGLQAKYDSNPGFDAISACGAMTFYCEPFIRQTADPQNCANLLTPGTGYSEAADQAAINAMIDDQVVWQNARAFLAFNPYQYCDGTGAHVDETFTETSMTRFRSELGSRAILQNNSIRYQYVCTTDPSCGYPPNYDSMYPAMFALGGPISFQTATMARQVDPVDGHTDHLHTVLQWAAANGASGVELQVGFDNCTTYPTACISPTTLSSDDAALEAAEPAPLLRQAIGNAATGTKANINWSGNPTLQGDLLVAVIGVSNGGTAITPAGGWQLAVRQSNVAIYYICGAPVKSGTNTFTLGGSGDWRTVGLEYQNVASVSCLDGVGSNTSGSTLKNFIASGTATSADASEVAVAGLFDTKSLAGSNPTNGFVRKNASTSGTANWTGAYQKILTAPGTQSTQVSLSGTAKTRGVIATFAAN